MEVSRLLFNYLNRRALYGNGKLFNNSAGRKGNVFPSGPVLIFVGLVNSRPTLLIFPDPVVFQFPLKLTVKIPSRNVFEIIFRLPSRKERENPG